MNLKDKKLPLIAGGAAVVVILLLLIFMPSDKSGDQSPEVISKRVKIELADTATDISASTESSFDTVPTEAAPAVAQPLPAPVPEAKPAAPVQAKIEPKAVEPKPAATAITPSPAPKRVEQAVKAPVEKTLDAPKAVKTVKTEKKAVEKTKKAAASKRMVAGKAWALNIASFPSLSEAQSLAGKLKKGGYNAYISGFTKDSFKWHRVRVGFFASRDEAAKAGAAIQSKFRVDKPWVAKPDAAELKAHS